MLDALRRRIERRLIGFVGIGIVTRQKGHRSGRSRVGSHEGAAGRDGADPAVDGILPVDLAEEGGAGEHAVLDDVADEADEAEDLDGETDGRRIAFAAGDDRPRLDQALASASGESRARVQALIRAGHASVGGRTVTEPSHRAAAGEPIALEIPPAAPAAPIPEPIPLDIVHEDADLIVVDKPAGLVVHPAPGHRTGTLVNALLHHCGEALSGIGGVRRPGIVHRLDKDTSGLLVVAKTDRAHRSLAAQFADHGRTGDLERAYLAVVWGAPGRGHGTIDAPLKRSSANRMRRAVGRGPDAREAITHYEVLERWGPEEAPWASLVECRLETGRTHQIRVHMAHIGAPLLGDAEYGAGFRTKAAKLPGDARAIAEAFPRQALHAAVLAFAHPATGEVMRYESALPADLAALVEALRAAGA